VVLRELDCSAFERTSMFESMRKIPFFIALIVIFLAVSPEPNFAVTMKSDSVFAAVGDAVRSGCLLPR
jgi:hypothetical protein